MNASPALIISASTMGPHEPGTTGYRATHRTGHTLALSYICGLVRSGSTPADVAAYVDSLGMVGASVSRSIENEAAPGTFAEAVFEILCG